MRITAIHKATLNVEEEIKTATLSTINELLALTSTGMVIRYDTEDQKREELFSIKSSIVYDGGGFDVEAASTIYTLDSIVVIVNDYKRHGFVHYPNKYNAPYLWREDYHADISCFPIVLFKNELGIPHLIYGVAWNHVQVMNLATRQILTTSKSLILEGAEERHIKFYEKHTDHNKLAWPRPYDYFYGKLEMSPDQKNFLSAGWAWGSCDAYNIYELDHFINENRISEKSIGGWEHSNRGACWINNETVAVAYNPAEEGDEDSNDESPQEIHFYKVSGEKSEIEKRIKIVNWDLVNSNLYFNSALNAIITVSKKIGVAVFSLEGEILFQDNAMKQDAYDPQLNLFIKTSGNTVTVHRLGH